MNVLVTPDAVAFAIALALAIIIALTIALITTLRHKRKKATCYDQQYAACVAGYAAPTAAQLKACSASPRNTSTPTRAPPAGSCRWPPQSRGRP